MQTLQEEPPILQETCSGKQIQVCDQPDANFPMKISGINDNALYDTGANMSCMSYICYVKLKDLPSLKWYPPCKCIQTLVMIYVL